MQKALASDDSQEKTRDMVLASYASTAVTANLDDSVVARTERERERKSERDGEYSKVSSELLANCLSS